MDELRNKLRIAIEIACGETVIENAKWDIVEGVLIVVNSFGKPIAAYKKWAYIVEEKVDK
jgi:hypothetical protein